MPDLRPWARVTAQTNTPLRRGAWYRVVQLTPLDAVLKVGQQSLRVPRAFLQVMLVRPPLWSVVRPRRGDSYAVCPRCCARAPWGGSLSRMRCPGCKDVYKVGWSEAVWRMFEVPPGGLEPRALARARALARRLGLAGRA